MLQRDQLLMLTKNVANGAPSHTYSFNGENLSYEAMDKTLRSELNELYSQDPKLAFSIITETLDDILPAKVLERYGDFAEVRTFNQGEKLTFKNKRGKNRAKQFVTRVGLAGVYETFKLGEESFEVQTSAIGAAARIGFEEYLDGRADFAELTAIIMDGMDDFIYREIAKALMSSINQLPTANKVSTNGFNEAGMDHLINTVSAYGSPVIYCTREFAVKMVPQTGWVSDNMKDRFWEQGYLGNYKGCPVIVLPQSFEDETNAKKVIDPGYVWVIPAGDGVRPVKVAFEGTTHMRERENEDWSRDIQVYRKVGVGVIFTNNVGSYIDTSLAGKLENTVTL